MTDTRILTIDQGSTSTRAIIFDEIARPIATAAMDLPQVFPCSGWVEYDPMQIVDTVLKTSKIAVERASLNMTDISAIGISNQRETTVVWDRNTGQPVYNAISWQCRRTLDICQSLEADGYSDVIRKKTGLVTDPYFSGPKLKWILDEIPNGQNKALSGDLCFGTIDSWLIYYLSGGMSHVTDVSNASRTMLFNMCSNSWDPELLGFLDIPDLILPSVLSSSGEFGATDGDVIGGEIPITAAIGDQQAALYGQMCFDVGMLKCTYGTGAFVLMNNGGQPLIYLDKGLLSTIGWEIDNKSVYAIEGSAFCTGATIQWLKDGLDLFEAVADTEEIAFSVKDNGGVYFVPAFVGLGSPYWDPGARALISGITRCSTSSHLVRAALESTAFQVRDIIDLIKRVSGGIGSDSSLKVDGGQTNNRFLMQFQADILDRPIEVSQIFETTALGSAFLAGLGLGIWSNEDDIVDLTKPPKLYEPNMKSSDRERLYSGWLDALNRSLSNRN